MREMSHSQINEAMDEDNWTVTRLFGHDFAEAGGVPAPSTPVARTRAIILLNDLYHLDKMMYLQNQSFENGKTRTRTLSMLPMNRRKSSRLDPEKTSSLSDRTTT